MKKREDFFEQMKNHKISYYNSRGKVAYVIMALCHIIEFAVVFLCTIYNRFNSVTITIIIILAVLIVLAAILYIVCIFAKNAYLFKSGKLLNGLISFAILVVPVYVILLICYISMSQGKEVIITLFTATTTISAAILTIMGVHYTLVQQKNERTDKNNLVFELCNNIDTEFVYDLKNSQGDLSLEIKLKNISSNFGYAIGIYKLCGCDVYKIGEDFPYLSISPRRCLAISNIRINKGDDQLIFVYKDIGGNYYYLLFSVSGTNISNIEKAGKCDFEFLEKQIIETDETEKVINSTSESEKSIEAIETLQFERIDSITDRKEETKPNRVVTRDGFDLVVSDDGEIKTDVKLLSVLKKERLKLAKEKKIKAYMIFNNQQLVALATYKPLDEISFVSIYGLGKKKYDLYGELFIRIIVNYCVGTCAA